MFKYAICEIGGKQYKVLPNQPFEVSLKNGEDIVSETLLLMEGGKLKVGKPYLKDQLIFKILEQKLSKKVRVFKYHAKANYRKTIGFRSKLTKIVLTA